ncbi:hypothetical protein KCU65_g10178, partial [Aureobasidium melanogenum]
MELAEPVERAEPVQHAQSPSSAQNLPSQQSQQSEQSSRGRGGGRGRGGRGRGSRSAVVDDGQSGRHWSEQRKKELVDVLWIHAQAYNRIPMAHWYRRIQKHWKQKTGHDHSTIRRRIVSMVDERRRAWQLRTETSGTENETDYTVSMDRWIREVWDRAAEENSQALQSAEAQRRQSRRTERDRERMTARVTQQRAIDQSSEEDLTSEDSESYGAGAGDQFETESVNTEPEGDFGAASEEVVTMAQVAVAQGY